MKLLLESMMIFFGTLIAAALVALGDPGHAEVVLMRSAAVGKADRPSHVQAKARPQESIVIATAAWLGLR